jgi:signal transduction histidine kinase
VFDHVGQRFLDDPVRGQVDTCVQVEIEVRGHPRELPAGVDLAAYRIIQESLTNVIKHAGTGHSRVVVAYEPEALRVEVTDLGRGATHAAAGHGLIGMRERVALYGGELTAGPLPGRGFRVGARLPAEPVAAETQAEALAVAGS